MKNLIILSLLIAMIAGICSCTEKEDPIQTIKDRLVGTWVTRDYQRGNRYLYDSLVLRQDNTLFSALRPGEKTYGFTAGGDSIAIKESQSLGSTRYRLEFQSSTEMRIYRYGRTLFTDSFVDLDFIKR